MSVESLIEAGTLFTGPVKEDNWEMPSFQSRSHFLSRLDPPKGFDRNMYDGYWATNDPVDIRELTETRGYRIWSQGGGQNPHGSRNGSAVSTDGSVRIKGGVTDSGSLHELIFMYRPKYFRAEQNRAYREARKQQEAGLDPVRSGKRIEGSHYVGAINFS